MTMIKGQFVGVYHDTRGIFARFKPDNDKDEIDVPITKEQFESLDLHKPAKIIIQIVV